ncbi:pectate lyase [Dyadobacter sp. CY312]|uniref:pectate lyase n=1 Tax=Dyadobacter sp. CY312 TaxID=2907303 RepID=UPI001F2F810D|nr:pectate lyase [Dyadobacter sp. CY312]MCE7044139.1 pectate lyase [Dyadobacter sp. CY312]
MTGMRHFLVIILVVFGLSFSIKSFGKTSVLPKLHSESTVDIDTTAEKVLLAQRISGGWPKQIDTKAFDYNNKWSEEFIGAVKAGFNKPDATIDNHGTSREIRLLVKAYKETGNAKYLAASETGIRYLLKMQYKNGGFPQFFPDTSGYRKHITYNDNAMINALQILKEVSESKGAFEPVNTELKKQAAQAVESGIACILKTQIRINGKPTVWCAQHDFVTYQPAKARAFELASFSGAESVDITRFLMKIPNPTPEIKEAVLGALTWLNSATIKDIQAKRIKDPLQPKGQDVVVVPAPGAKIWARFYDLETGKPFFCGRDGIKKENLSEIENERRVGYAYYGTWPEKLLSATYEGWQTK